MEIITKENLPADVLAEAKELIKVIDSDKDGLIDLKEFKTVFGVLFDRINDL